ncbi:YqgQ family protein [Streptococcus equi subsp. zooepidemicus]|uniref:YqgQ family protein n=1 Tax=Streptococcus equi TaxID=1336 RepID=UPI001E2E3F92|nr:YqgQ family protein [Streptococcus equi]MCD3434309.1 YqgQ family protein [Streptococcus equi subsp. zooepidemicus]
MKTLYDVQQLLKGLWYCYLHGKRLYDIEMMKIELQRLYDGGLLDKQAYLTAELILRREHRLELKREGQENESKIDRD